MAQKSQSEQYHIVSILGAEFRLSECRILGGLFRAPLQILSSKFGFSSAEFPFMGTEFWFNEQNFHFPSMEFGGGSGVMTI